MQDDSNIDTRGTEVMGAVSASVSVTASISAVVQKNVSVAVRGYVQALRRLEEATGNAHRPDDVYIALAETVNWLDSIASFVEYRQTIKGHHLVQAALFARARMHHHWASVTYFDEAQAAWVWRPADQLPVPDDERHWDEGGQALYVRHLAQTPILHAVQQLEPLLRELAPNADLD